jgi:hypothetical protein
MIDRELAKELLRLRRIGDFVWHWFHKPLLLFYVLFCLVHILINKL